MFVEFDSEETVNKVLNHTTENPDYQHKIGSDEVRVTCSMTESIDNHTKNNNLKTVYIFISVPA